MLYQIYPNINILYGFSRVLKLYEYYYFLYFYKIYYMNIIYYKIIYYKLLEFQETRYHYIRITFNHYYKLSQYIDTYIGII